MYDSPEPPPPPPAVAVSRGLQRVVLALLVAVAGVSIAGLAAGMFGVFGVGPVLVFGVAVAYTLWALWGPAAAGADDLASPGRAVVLLALIVAVGSGYFATGRAFADGEAAAHAIAAVGLSERGSLVDDGFPGGEGFVLDAPGFALVDGGRTPDAPRMFTALAAAAAWAGPVVGARVGAVLAALVLLLAYAFASRFLLAGTAAATTVALAVTPLFLLAARDTHPVMLTAVFTLGGFWALAVATGDEEGTGKAVVAGALLGCAAATSIAGFVALAAAATVLAANEVAGLAEGWIVRNRRRRLAAFFGAGAAVPVILGAVDAAMVGRLGAVAGRAALLLLPAALVLLAHFVRSRRIPAARATRRIPRVVVPVLVVAAVAYVLLVRPGAAQYAAGPVPGVAAAQAAEGVAVEPARTYAEATGTWLWWYAPGILLVGLAGWALLAAADLRDRRGRLRLPVVVTGFALAATLFAPGAGSLQPVAAFPFLPLVLPGLLVTAGWLAEVLYADPERAVAQTAAVLLVAGLVVPGVWRSVPVWDAEPQAGAVTGVETVCAVLEDGDVVVVADPDPALELGRGLAPAISGYCGVPAAAVVAGASGVPAGIDTGAGRLVVVTPDPEPFGPSGIRPRRIGVLEVTGLRPTVTEVPGAEESRQWTLGWAVAG
jgi:hypothetical protein